MKSIAIVNRDRMGESMNRRTAISSYNDSFKIIDPKITVKTHYVKEKPS